MCPPAAAQRKMVGTPRPNRCAASRVLEDPLPLRPLGTYVGFLPKGAPSNDSNRHSCRNGNTSRWSGPKEKRSNTAAAGRRGHRSAETRPTGSDTKGLDEHKSNRKNHHHQHLAQSLLNHAGTYRVRMKTNACCMARRRPRH